MLLHNFIILTAYLTVKLCAASEWHYPDMSRDEAFPKWGGMCDNGNRQSPIDLTIKQALVGEFDKLKFTNYARSNKGVVMVNNGHTIQLSEFPHKLKLQAGPLNGEYVLEQIHFHWWSEHTFESIRYPLEAHIVHRNKRYSNMEEASKYKDGVTVLAVLYHVSNRENEAISSIIESLEEVKSYQQLNKPTHLKKEFVVRNLFPTLNAYMTYAGSLTTPLCVESVTWIVLKDTFPVTLEQTEKFREIEMEEKKKLENNYRFIQNTNNRPVVYVSAEKSAATSRHNNINTLAITFLVLPYFMKFLVG